jgi:glycosyltransferase involved in cell wall biosynthesis
MTPPTAVSPHRTVSEADAPLRILMLGWEFPPFIAGGLGVACYGLTKALDQLGHKVIFVLPRPVDRSHASHVRLLSPDAPRGSRIGPGRTRPGSRITRTTEGGMVVDGFEQAEFHELPSTFSHPYPSFNPAVGNFEMPATPSESVDSSQEAVPGATTASAGTPVPALANLSQPASNASTGMHLGSGGGAGHGYGSDLFGDAERYARLCVALALHEDFDVIHAHDWLTYPAGAAVAKVTGKPLVVHVHSTEHDRSGDNINRACFDIERAGMLAADRVLAVSELTKSICVKKYSIDPAKIDVVYNGIDRVEQQPPAGVEIEPGDKIVLFLGRITMQKGPEYFIAAAKRVLEKMDNVKFIVAGSGDMALRMVELAAAMGIGHKVLFTGFLRGKDVDRVFALADCYVMPSVSEPFGLAALEAIHHDVPVILSKTAGAAEVLTHVLKVDFWDTDEMANKIVAVLKYPPLSQTLREHGRFELRRLTWGGAAEKCVKSYRAAMDTAPVA